MITLPVAASAPFEALLDGHSTVLTESADHLFTITIPRGDHKLQLNYLGYFGEWLVLAVSLISILFCFLAALCKKFRVGEL